MFSALPRPYEFMKYSLSKVGWADLSSHLELEQGIPIPLSQIQARLLLSLVVALSANSGI